jgi:hypothetical protein
VYEGLGRWSTLIHHSVIYNGGSIFRRGIFLMLVPSGALGVVNDYERTMGTTVEDPQSEG